MTDPADGDGGPAPFSPSIALVTAARDLEARLAGVLEPHGLTVRKFLVLGHVARTPGVSQSDLARRSRLTPPGVHAILRSLADLGLVRSAPTGSGLPASVTVTREGSALLARLGARIAELDADAFDSPARRDLALALALVDAEESPAAAPPED